MTKRSNLLTHCGARKVSLDELELIPTPEPMGARHKPVPHAELAYTLKDVLGEFDLKVEREEYAVGCRVGDVPDTSVFGVLDLVPTSGGNLPKPNGDWGFAMGFRSNNAQKHNIKVVGGGKVFCCDNLSLSGDSILLRRMHTLRLNLMDALTEAIERYVYSMEAFALGVKALKSARLEDFMAERFLYRLFTPDISGEKTRKAVLPTKLMAPVHELYFKTAPDAPDEYADCAPRTAWGLSNAVTRVLRDEPLGRKLKHTQAIDVPFRRLVARCPRHEEVTA